MKTFTLATLSGLVAIVLAAAVPEEASSLVKKADNAGIYITLCNDFHGGKPCEKKPVTPGKCTYVDNLGRGYVSSVSIPATPANITCTFWSAAGCTGGNITLSSPGTKDLTDYDFDNKIITFACTD